AKSSKLFALHIQYHNPFLISESIPKPGCGSDMSIIEDVIGPLCHFPIYHHKS
ncbi:9493_t:CDS:2, partial [Entrophospora sp. SA101]